MSTNSHIGEKSQRDYIGTAVNDNDEISLKELILKIREWWQYLWSKKLIILSFGLLGGVLGFTYAYFQKPVYTATTTFVLEDEKGSGGGLGNLAGLASMAGIDLSSSGGGIFEGDNIIQLYTSRNMIQKTLLSPIDSNGKELLMDRYIKINNLGEAWAKTPDLLKLSFQTPSSKLSPRILRTRDSILEKAVEDISVNYLAIAKPDKKLSIIKVVVRAKDEEFAKVFEDELVKNVNDFYVQTKTKKSLANVAILQHKTDSVRAVMNGAIFSAVAVADATPNLNPTRQVQRLAPAQKAQFSAETNKEVLKSLVQNLELTKMGLLKETPLIQTVDVPIYPLNKEKFGKAKGIILGGILFGFLICLFYTSKLFIAGLMSE